jgi:hypothetical protein
LGLAAAGSIAAEQYEQPTERQAAAVLPPVMVTGPHHRVQDAVVAYGYMDHFIVESPFGHFEVVGDGALRKLLNELHAIAALREIKTSKTFADAVVAAAEVWLTGAVSSLVRQQLGKRGITVTEEIYKRVEIID